MTTLWFVLVLAMLAIYVLLDGFDLGAGAIHVFVAADEKERRQVLRAIGPVWDGNEVWLIAAGGTLFFAFPLLYASSFTGFYLPLTIVLWLLMIRGVAIEVRSHLDHPLWATFWDGAFFLGSALLCLFLGVALGNVLRGVPLDASHYFFEPLWTSLDPRVARPGVLDGYTILVGMQAVAALIAHGALYLVLKTSGELQAKARRFALGAWMALLPLTAGTTFYTFALRPAYLERFLSAPWGSVFPVVGLAGLLAMWPLAWKCRDRSAFASSCLYLGGMLASAGYVTFPAVLPAVDPRYSLTIANAATTPYGLTVGLIWWSIGMVLALTYFALIYRLFRGKVAID